VILADVFDPELLGRVITGGIVFLVTSVLSFVIGRYWGRYQAYLQWQHKQFLGRIIVSINCLADGWLRIRTVFERSLEEVFLNPVAIEKVREASLKTTVENPILPIAKEDRWFLLNFVLNAVAEKFSDGAVRYDAGQPLKPVPYLLFLTCEQVGEDRIRKVRALMVRKDMIENFPYMETMPKLEREWHGDRIVTLRQAARLYREQPDDFLALELYV
jgi:hypothetical protein